MSSGQAAASELHVPYYIFLKCAGRYADADLLRRFGLVNYCRVPADNTQHLRQHAILADDGPWTLLADDWYYTLWHLPTTRPMLEELAQQCDVFACSVGDCDRSFDFVYYRDGRLVRKYVVTDPHFRGRVLVQNVGYPLLWRSRRDKARRRSPGCPGDRSQPGHSHPLRRARAALLRSAGIGRHLYEKRPGSEPYAPNRLLPPMIKRGRPYRRLIELRSRRYSRRP